MYYLGRTKYIKCGEDDIVCLEFHHLDPSKKKFDICAGLRKSYKSLYEEVQKCILICTNCHRKLERDLKQNEFKAKLDLFLHVYGGGIQ